MDKTKKRAPPSNYWKNPAPNSLMTVRELRQAAGYSEKAFISSEESLKWLKRAGVKPTIIEQHGSRSRVYVRRDDAAKFLTSVRCRRIQRTIALRNTTIANKKLAASTAASTIKVEQIAPPVTVAAEPEVIVIAETRHEPATVTFVERLGRLEQQNAELLSQVQRLVQMWS